MTPTYQSDRVTLYLARCEDVLPTLAGVDAMLTDPPYGAKKAAWDSEFILPPLLPVKVAGIMPGIANLGVAPQRLGNLSYRWTLAAYLTNGMARGAMGFGNWIACMVYATALESVFALEQDCKAFPVGMDPKPDHPSPKPLNVTRWFCSRLPGDEVLDPFMGSGTTGVAAVQLGRRFIGIECDPAYYAIAERRIRQAEQDATLFEQAPPTPEAAGLFDARGEPSM